MGSNIVILSLMSDKLDSEFETDEYPDSVPNQLTDETITQEQINEMKMLGLSKPDAVSWAKWQAIQSERSEHTHMIHMAAAGIPQGKIAEALGYDQVHVSKVLSVPWVKQKIQEEIHSIYGEDHKKALKDRAMKSIAVVDEVLDSGKESEKASMAKWVLEHSVGKAQQEVKHSGTILADFMVKVEQMEQNQLRDVGSGNPLLTQQSSKFDTILNEIVPVGAIVGKRSKLEEQT